MRFLPRPIRAEYADGANPDTERPSDRERCEGSRGFARAVGRGKRKGGVLANGASHVRCAVFGARASDDDRTGTRYRPAFHERPQAIHVNSKERLEIAVLRLNPSAG